MSNQLPELEDYVRLFRIYGKDLGSIYLEEGEQDPYEFLFEQVIQLLIKPSYFNDSLPTQFVATAKGIYKGEAKFSEHFKDFDNRHFMLCDLYDLVMLKGGLHLKAKQSQPQDLS